jgi:hypothetical protein
VLIAEPPPPPMSRFAEGAVISCTAEVRA